MRNGLTPSFPFTVDSEESDYILIERSQDLIRQNLTNLILTSPGERMMDPEFGVGIKRFLFENRTQSLLSAIKDNINSQVKKYMPFVSVANVVFATSEENPNFLGITINYFVTPLKLGDNLNLTFNLITNSLIRR
jgi:phage baseplate assembly protein W